MPQIRAFQVAKQIQIKEFRRAFAAPVLAGDSAEALWAHGAEGRFAAYEYGAVAFVGVDELEQSKLLSFLAPFCVDPLADRLSEMLDVTVAAGEAQVGHTSVTVPELNLETLRILMTYVAQSVALDFFATQAQRLLTDTKALSLVLEEKGRISLSGDQLARYIAKSMNLKHTIVGSLYILDSPDETWENQELHRLDRALKRTFDIQTRYRSVAEDIQMAQENLDLLRDLSQSRKSTQLEWIIIALILVEVVNMLVERIWRHA